MSMMSLHETRHVTGPQSNASTSDTFIVIVLEGLYGDGIGANKWLKSIRVDE